ISLSRPTRAEQQVWQELSQQADAQLAAFAEASGSDVAKLNAALRSGKLAPISVETHKNPPPTPPSPLRGQGGGL
ncbi:MAG: hypothetical protein ACRER1_03010, partial [Gammaproteobacteria bacterium]